MNRLRIKICFGLALIFSWTQGYATHLMGGEITWTCQGNGTYIFRMKVYRDCLTAVFPPAATTLTVHNHPTVSSIAMNQVSVTDISPQCNGAGPTYTCANPNGNTAVQEYIYQSPPVNLPGVPPAQGWVFTWSDCCRNAAISNLFLTFNGPGNPNNGFTLRAKMFAYNGQSAQPCFDNSPVFQERPAIIICAGTPFTYNPNAYDPDLDSLSYEFSTSLDYLFPGSAFNATTPPTIPFVAGYTVNSPFPGPAQNVPGNPPNVPVSLNPVTGEMSFQSFMQGNFVNVVKVSAFKCRQKVAEIYREIQVVILSCGANFPPSVTAPFINTGTGLYTNYVDTVTAGDLVTFTLTGTDGGFLPTGFPQNVVYTAAGGQFGANYTDPNSGCDNLPCATLSPPPPVSNAGSVSVDFNWQTGCEHVAMEDACITNANVHTFTFMFRDDYCPAPSYTVVTATIIVKAIGVAESPDLRCLSVAPNGDVTLNWLTAPDTASTFNSYHIYVANNLNGPYTVVDSIFNYNATSYTHIGAGAHNGPLYYFVRTRSGCFGRVYTPATDTLRTIYVDISTLVNNDYTVSWNVMSAPPVATAYPDFRIYRRIDNGPWQFYTATPLTSLTLPLTKCSLTVHYRVELQDSSGCISVSNIDSAFFQNTDPPNSMVLDSASVWSDNQTVNLGWSPSPDGDVVAYIVMCEINGVLTPIDTIYNINNTSYQHNNPAVASASQVYAIAPIDSCGNTGTAGIPHQTIYLSYEVDGCSGKAELTWSPYIGFSAIGGYQVFVSQDNGPFNLAGTAASAGQSYTHTNMLATSSYCFFVRAFDINGLVSASSNTVCFVADVVNQVDYSYLTYATVYDDLTNDIECYYDTSADVYSYLVTRFTRPDGPLDTLGTFYITSSDEFIFYRDQNAKAQQNSYDYKFLLKDACDNLTGETNIGRTILLSGKALDGLINRLIWNRYKTWDGGVEKYSLYRCDATDKSNPILVKTFDTSTTYFEHDVIDSIPADGRICYFIRAEELPGNQYGFKEKSESNVVCLTQFPVMYIPNAFNPDGIEQQFGPKGIYAAMAKEYSFLIYNRWGEKIFETHKPGELWDGVYKGDRVQQGVYVYLVDYNSYNGRTFHRVGTVTVIK